MNHTWEASVFASNMEKNLSDHIKKRKSKQLCYTNNNIRELYYISAVLLQITGTASELNCIDSTT